MDIEGHEYDVIVGMSSDLLRRFRIVVMELHGVPAMLNQDAAPLVDAVFRKMTKFHDVVHLHPNKCCGSQTAYGIEIPTTIEVTLHRRDRRRGDPQDRSDFPYPLDRDNVEGIPSLTLPAAWYQG